MNSTEDEGGGFFSKLFSKEPKEKVYNSAALLPMPRPTACPDYGGGPSSGPRVRSSSVEFLTQELQDEANMRDLESLEDDLPAAFKELNPDQDDEVAGYVLGELHKADEAAHGSLDLQIYLKAEERKLYELVDKVGGVLKSTVLDKFSKLLGGLQQVKEVSDDLDSMTNLCKNTRRFMHKSEEQLTGAGRRIHQNVRTKDRLLQQQKVLLQVQQIWTRQVALKQALEDDDFPRAVSEYEAIDKVLKEGMEELADLSCFELVLGARGNIQRLVRDLKMAVDLAAQQVCSFMDERKFGYLLGVYQTSLLESEDFGAKMRHSFQQAVKYVSKEAVKAYVMQATDDEDKHEKFQIMKYKELCQHISGKHYVLCTQAVYERFWDVMHSHWLMIQLVQTSMEASPNNEYLVKVRDDLLELRRTVWDLIKRRVEHLLNFHLASCKVEDMLRVIDLTKRLMDVGELYSDSDSHVLRGSINNKTSQYFRSFHQSNAEELLIVLDNESWMPIPVASDFSVKSIKELHLQGSMDDGPNSIADSGRANGDFVNSEGEWASRGNIFAMNNNSQGADAEAVEEEEESNKQLLAGEIDEDAAPSTRDELPKGRRVRAESLGEGHSGLVLTNGSMVLIRAVAKYILIMEKLDLGSEALSGLILLHDLYVYDAFTVAYMRQSALTMGAGLTQMLEVMRNNLRKSPYFASRFPAPLPVEKKKESKVDRMGNFFSRSKDDESTVTNEWPCPCEVTCELDSADDLFGLHHRYTAIKSLSFLRQVLESVKVRLSDRFLRGAAGQAQGTLLKDFYANVERNVELEYALLRNIAQSLIQLEHIPGQIEKCAWDTEDLDEELRCHEFVPAMLAEARVFFSRLEPMHDGMGDDATETIVRAAIEAAMQAMVDGFARVKKCTNEGRVAMSFDLKQFQMGLQDMCSIRPIPSVALVEEFIKGYFVLNDCQGEVEVLDWVVKHVFDYTEEQVKSLLMVSYISFKNVKRKVRNELLDSVSQHYKELL